MSNRSKPSKGVSRRSLLKGAAGTLGLAAGSGPLALQKLAAVTEAVLETARMAWHVYRSTTPEACFALLSANLNRLPLLKPVLRDLLEELPSASTGLGATETRMLELIGRVAPGQSTTDRH